jgi:hypothetical protein
LKGKFAGLSLLEGYDSVIELAASADFVVSSRQGQYCLLWHFERLWGILSCVFDGVHIGRFLAECYHLSDSLQFVVTNTH